MTQVRGFDPRTGEPIGAGLAATDADGVAAAATAAAAAAISWAATTRADRAAVLETVATALDAETERLVDVADAESALGRPRLTGEVARTSGQLRMFAGILRDGSYLGVVHSPQTPARPDVRRMLRPIGPVAVFAASNFPFAFSVLGGDTASALAAGCPVVVKAHEAHPETSRQTFEVARRALARAGAPDAVLSLVAGVEAGPELVRRPEIRAVGFTGSLRGGRFLLGVASGRPDPIPFYGELGSVNPSVVLPVAAAARPGEIVAGYVGSLTLGAGQYCTNPGLLFVPSSMRLEGIGRAVVDVAPAAMLSARIHESYRGRLEVLDADADLRRVDAAGPDAAPEVGPWAAVPQVYALGLDAFAARLDALSEETFGPAGIVVGYDDVDQLAAVLRRLPGQLSASVHADAGDAAAVTIVQDALIGRVGRLAYNQWPTGVAVCWAQTHGGPWPATTAPGTTSVGGTAIDRWLVPVSFQSWPEELLPAELREDDPDAPPRLVEP